MIAIAGPASGQAPRVRMVLFASAAIRPQAGLGSCTPAPMKLSPASTRMMPAAESEASTMIGAITLGSRWRHMIRAGVAPIARAAST